ncbi:hypothetical protein [Prevotella dentasini]|uniref:hypothetical protein n=1 Tax=Prevotella dentasini TaxID=589537 RepID=UPI00046AB814|nr:hypothetical protein [Prevotella dentasini]
MELADYKQEILSELLNRRNVKGEPLMGEEAAQELLAQLSDEQLEEGMLFNEPSDVADVLTEFGLTLL